MNKLFSLATISMISLAVFSGCTKVSQATTQTYASYGAMSAVVGGQAFTAVNCFESSNGDTHIITASFGADTSIGFNLQIPDFTTTTYTFDSVEQAYNVQYQWGANLTSNVVNGKTGSLTIASINPRVSMTGSFNFTCVNGAVITGTFTAALPQ